jgi:hypothetical protein
MHLLRQDRDAGSCKAAVDGIHYLEQNIPADGYSYTYSTLVAGSTRTYNVAFNLVSTDGSTRSWTITVTRP